MISLGITAILAVSSSYNSVCHTHFSDTWNSATL